MASGSVFSVAEWVEPVPGPREVHDALTWLDEDTSARGHLSALARDGRLHDVPLRDLLLVDAETTGLSGGSGTLAWLVGLGRLQRSGDRWSLAVEQHVIEAHSGEPRLLEGVLARIDASRGLVTYNGRAYDLPLLGSRCVIHRLRPPRVAAHADLLHPARRFLAGALPDARLATVEARLLGRPRVDDIPGAEIPAAWFALVLSGRRDGFEKALRHNRLDLGALAGALGALVSLARGRAVAGVRPDEVARAEHALARGDGPLARQVLAASCEPDAGAAEPASRTRRRARLVHRVVGAEGARKLWQALVRAGDPSPEPWLALARLAERRDGDLAAARELALAARDRTLREAAAAAIRRRIARLDRQMARALR